MLICKHIDILRKSILAGICIGIGATTYLSCSNKYIGSFLFGIGLFLICTYNLNLFTGKIGYAIQQRKQFSSFYYVEMWLGNLIGCAMIAFPLRVVEPRLENDAKIMVNIKLSQTLPQVVVFGVMCGIMMFIAVTTYKISENPQGKILGIFLSVAIFILCGFEHSIADICYMLYAIDFNITEVAKAVAYIITVSLSNAAGSILLWWLMKGQEYEKEQAN